jgi:penicillin-binding protein 1C
LSTVRAAFLTVASALCAVAAAAQNLPSFDAVRAAHAPSDITVLDRHGAPLQTLRTDHSLRRGPWVALGDMSPALLHAVLLSEDRRFWAHAGVDWQALAASAWAQAWNQRTRGASTVTMQLAGLLDESLIRPAGGRSTGQKISQVLRAQQLEAGWRKTQILEAYLNAVPLRGELVGVAAASSQLFGIHSSGLDHAQAAVLAVMLRGPNASATALQRRACEVLQQQRLGCDGLALLIEQALVRRPGALDAAAWAPHLARHLLQQASANPSAQPLRSTLDAGVQRVALAALRQQLAELRGRNVEDGAVVVLDNRSGEVLAWVGSSGAGSSAAEVDAVLARRQPGSTLKPFVYALALQQRLITAASQLDDAPLHLAVGAGSGGGSGSGSTLYRPQNYDHQFKGWVSVRTALASSLNVPAVRVGAMLGPEALFAHLNRAGLRLRESAGYHGQALALGSADVTLLDLSNAYRALAQRGQWSRPQFVVGQVAEPGAVHSLASPAVAYIVADMLADRTARALTFGLDSVLATNGWAAVKTGTSKDMRDNWCVGFTDRYTVGVWVGNASGAPMHGVSGVSGAAPVWRVLVTHLHAAAPSLAPSLPAGLVAQQGEWFLAGTEPGLGAKQSPSNVRTVARFGIQSPADGSVVVLDPGIPISAQKLAFEGAAGQWFVAGRLVGSGSKLWWPARPGRYVLELRAADGTAPERVRFEVRLGAKPQAAERLKMRSVATSITMPHKLYSSEPISAALKPST